jgi:hypothetical protein
MAWIISNYVVLFVNDTCESIQRESCDFLNHLICSRPLDESLDRERPVLDPNYQYPVGITYRFGIEPVLKKIYRNLIIKNRGKTMDDVDIISLLNSTMDILRGRRIFTYVQSSTYIIWRFGDQGPQRAR